MKPRERERAEAAEAQPHEWVAMIVYRLDEEDARRLNEGPAGPPVPVLMGVEVPREDQRAFLKMEQIDQERSVVGCYACEAKWAKQVAAEPCPGHPHGYDADGTPHWRGEPDSAIVEAKARG